MNRTLLALLCCSAAIYCAACDDDDASGASAGDSGISLDSGLRTDSGTAVLDSALEDAVIDAEIIADSTVASDAEIDAEAEDAEVEDAAVDAEIEDGEIDPCANPTEEICDGIDNDCDGETDEGFENIEEICDGIDNNCNGQIDEGLHLGEPCESVGICAGDIGVYECDGEGGVRCSTGPGGSNTRALESELCNGLDDDCDGETDEDLGLGDACTGIGACGAGTLECEKIGDQYTGQTICSSMPTGSMPQNTSEICNNVDDDCDGLTDEDLTRSCYYGAPGTQDVGECHAGVETCNGGVFGDCEGYVIPTAELCDGKDNDCNGVIDDNINVVEICNNIDDDCDGLTDEDIPETEISCGFGVCAATGIRRCENGGFVDDCTPHEATGNDDNCNGIDEDCDGITDGNYVGAETTCGLGECATTGRMACVNGVEVDQCSAPLTTGPDNNCDGKDNDCDGETDEHYLGDASCCKGICCDNVVPSACVNGQVIPCQSPEPPADAIEFICNGLDYDCDGYTDEDWGTGPEACGTPDNPRECVTEDNPGCGTGVCYNPNDWDECLYGEEMKCEPFAPRSEIDNDCNNEDDDCDGETDEDFVTYSDTCGLGVCERTVEITCINGVQSQCIPGDPSNISEAACNGLDDDCDGYTDEDVEQFINREVRLTTSQATTAGFTAAAQYPQFVDTGRDLIAVWTESHSKTEGDGENTVTTFDEKSGIYMARFSYAGVMSGNAKPVVTGATAFRYPNIAKTSSGFIVVWNEQYIQNSNETFQKIGFNTIDANNNNIGTPKYITSTNTTRNQVDVECQANQCAIAWIEQKLDKSQNLLKLVKVNNNVASSETTLADNSNGTSVEVFAPDLVALANGGFAVTYTTSKALGGNDAQGNPLKRQSVYFQKLDNNGNRTAGPTRISSEDYNANTAALIERDGGYAAAFIGKGGEEVTFELLDSNANITKSVTLTGTTETPIQQAMSPSLVKTSDGFGLAWNDKALVNNLTPDNSEVRFQHFDANGNEFNNIVRISNNAAQSLSPIISWRNQDGAGTFSIMWYDERIGYTGYTENGSRKPDDNRHFEIFYTQGTMGCAPSSPAAVSVN